MESVFDRSTDMYDLKELTPEREAPIREEARELFQRTNNNDGESTERTIKYNARDEPAL